MTDTNTVPSRQDLIMDSVNKFFLGSGNKTHLQQMLPILNQSAHISLRILDYFVTNYAKKKKIVYSYNDRNFNVYHNYKAQLKAFSKKQFDPFCRKVRKVQGKTINEAIKFYFDEKKHIETTVGQLNFFKWAVQNGVLAYIVDHLTDIVEDMILSSKTKKTKKTTKSKKCDKNDKSALITPALPSSSVTATRTVTTTKKVKVIVSFA